jgi:methylenetetrahydrofolate dehydrogenase (NADP+)/methenyltetrahydrofolate cyclohydrolase
MIIDGKKISLEILAEIREEIAAFKTRAPCLAVILVGEHPASALYVKRKMEACKAVGILSIQVPLSAETSKEVLLNEIHTLNEASDVDGILVQLPLPAHINPLEINAHILPSKDVDGLHPLNMGKLLMGEKDGFIPCTPLGIQHMIKRSGFEIAGKHAVVMGRSMIVGKPMAALLMQAGDGGNATVSVLHSRSKHIPEICRMADIIIAAIGQPRFLTRAMVKKDAIVIDVGINRIEADGKYKIVGDADFDSLVDHCKAISPVPGGVGPMTIAMLLSNTLKSYKSRIQ